MFKDTTSKTHSLPRILYIPLDTQQQTSSMSLAEEKKLIKEMEQLKTSKKTAAQFMSQEEVNKREKERDMNVSCRLVGRALNDRSPPVVATGDTKNSHWEDGCPCNHLVPDEGLEISCI